MNAIYILPYEKLDHFIGLVVKDFRLIGPTVKHQQIVYADIINAAQLPWGYVDNQDAGRYQLSKQEQPTVFGWVNGAQGIKPFLFKSIELLWQVERDSNGKLIFSPKQPKQEALAFFGIRPCDLRALLIQDKVFLDPNHTDAHYAAYRKNNFIIVANCTRSSNNCFCVAMQGYPKANADFDIALTEIEQGFTFEIGSEKALAYAKQLQLLPASQQQVTSAVEKIDAAAAAQTKKIDPINDPKKLMQRLDHPYWNEVAKQCLSCGNCTQVCPTCFCHDEVEQPSLDGNNSEHLREWGSCFTQNHSYIHGKTIRPDIKSRYKQWLTHKFSTWHDQYGTSGCVGCGRCITWCPTGIDTPYVIQQICKDDDHE